MHTGCFSRFLILCILASPCIQAQHLNFKTFSFDNGLKSYNIFNTVQDQHGFIWVATQDGLYRYNGKTFQVFKNNAGPVFSTPGNAFMDVAFDNGDQVYAADYNNSIDIINTTDLRLVSEQAATHANSLSDYWITDIVIDRSRNIWLKGVDYFAFRKIGEQRFTVVRNIAGIPGPANADLVRPISEQHMAVGLPGNGTVIYDTRSLKESARVMHFSPSGTGTADHIKDILLLNDTVWLATDYSLIAGTWKNNQWNLIGEFKNELFTGVIVTSLAATSGGVLWLGTNNGLIRFDSRNASFTRIQVIPGKSRWLADNNINNLMTDREGNLWISSSNVLQMLSTGNRAFRTFSGGENGDIAIDHIYTLARKDPENMFATGTNGLFIVNTRTGHTEKVKGTEALGYVHHIEKADPDCWILSTDYGMYAYDPVSGTISRERLLKKYPEWEPYVRHYFNTAQQAGNCLYWASEEMEGLLKWDIQHHRIRQFKNGLPANGGIPENHLRNIRPDRNGFLWLLSDLTATQFDPRTDSAVQIIRKDRHTFNASFLFDMYDDGETLWFATYGGGINAYNKKTRTWKYITEKEGLANNCVYGLAPESDQVLWATTNMGMTRINLSTHRCTNYYYEDGLHDNSFDEKGILLDGRLLYAGGVKGFTEINLDNVQDHTAAYPVFIHQVEYFVNDKRYSINKLDWDRIDFPRKTGTIIIHLAALTYSGSNSPGFSYRIGDIQQEFINAAEDNTISLNGLAYGKHELIIRHRNRDGSYNGKELRLLLYIQPRWFETWWFRAGLILFFLGLGYLFFLLRIRQLKKEEKIRNQLASDLHDDLGSTLNSIKVHSSLAQMEKDNPKHLLMIKQGTQDAISGIRDIIWVLDDKKDRMGDVLDRVSQFAAPLCEASGILFRVEISDGTREISLGKEEKRNLYMILKESINNSLKYAAAGEIKVITEKSGKKWTLFITDNGKGFDSSSITGGYGLKNISNRARAIGYTARIISAPGQGTRIELRPG